MASRYHVSTPWFTAPRSWMRPAYIPTWHWQKKKYICRRHRSRRRARRHGSRRRARRHGSWRRGIETKSPARGRARGRLILPPATPAPAAARLPAAAARLALLRTPAEPLPTPAAGAAPGRRGPCPRPCLRRCGGRAPAGASDARRGCRLPARPAPRLSPVGSTTAPAPALLCLGKFFVLVLVV